MPDIKLRDGSGVENTYQGINTITLPLADGSGNWTFGLTDDYFNFNNSSCYGLFTNEKIFNLFYSEKNRLSFNNVTNITGMFIDTPQIPWDIDITTVSTNANFPSYSNLGQNCKITTMEDCTLTFINTVTDALQFFNNCQYLRTLPNIVGLTVPQSGGFSCGNAFSSDYSLRSIPSSIIKEFYSRGSSTSWNYAAWYLNNNYALDELNGIPVWRPVTLTDNQMSNLCYNNFRVKNITFDTDNGTPYAVNWKNQTLNLSNNRYIGYAGTAAYILNYNSGITLAKRVTDATSYAALKNDPDWWTTDILYSRYNHDSAVATINSLPDASAYLATAGGTNTIKFKGTSGTNTDGGAISNLTEAEIQVATDKGWTVTIE